MMILDAFIHWLHVMAAVVWIGGMIFTSFVLQPVMRKAFDAKTRMPVYHEMGWRFKIIQVVCLGVLFATGLYKLWGLRSSPEVFHSSFGHILGVKLALVFIVLILSYFHSYVWGPQLTAMSRESGKPAFQALTNRLFFWGRMNLGLSVIIIFLAVLLRFNPF